MLTARYASYHGIVIDINVIGYHKIIDESCDVFLVVPFDDRLSGILVFIFTNFGDKCLSGNNVDFGSYVMITNWTSVDFINHIYTSFLSTVDDNMS